MSKRLILFAFAMLALALISLPVLEAQTAPPRGIFKLISSYDDDPFVADSVVERMATSRFGETEDRRLILLNNLIRIEDEQFIYRQNSETGEYFAFANNPWPLPASNAVGDFMFPDEARFPRHEIERDADGKPVLDENGLQLWKPRDLRRGMTTAFEAANAVKDAAEFWSERSLAWGTNGRLDINSHAFIDFNAFFSPTARALYFGVVPYRLPGQTEVKMFEMATSWEIVAHESGHALHRAIKPNADLLHPGYKTWSESFGDQMAMWTSLRDRDRLLRLLAETNGDLNRSNALTRIGEILGGLIGEDVSLRDAFHDKKVSDTSDEEHERSEVFTGAAFKSVIRGNRFRLAPGPEQTIVRVRLTQGRGQGSTPLDNHGILVFRASGMLADYHSPLPSGDSASLLADAFSQARAMAMIGQANQLSLDQHGAPLSIVRSPEGQLTVEARVMRGEGLNTYMEVFTLDNPQGERREIVISPVPPHKRIRISDDLLK